MAVPIAISQRFFDQTRVQSIRQRLPTQSADYFKERRVCRWGGR